MIVDKIISVVIETKYGNIEHSFMLFNIAREDAQYLAEWFEQESFFFGINGSPATLIYYETSESDPSKYRKVEESKNITNESDADDFFSRHGDFKFKFDLDYFELYKAYAVYDQGGECKHTVLRNATENKLEFIYYYKAGPTYISVSIDDYLNKKFKIKPLVVDEQ